MSMAHEREIANFWPQNPVGESQTGTLGTDFDGDLASFFHSYDRWYYSTQPHVLRSLDRCAWEGRRVLERAGAWPEEAQLKLIRAALEIEREHVGIYRLSEEERADLNEAEGEFDRCEIASERDAAQTFEHLRGK